MLEYYHLLVMNDHLIRQASIALAPQKGHSIDNQRQPLYKGTQFVTCRIAKLAPGERGFSRNKLKCWYNGSGIRRDKYPN